MRGAASATAALAALCAACAGQREEAARAGREAPRASAAEAKAAVREETRGEVQATDGVAKAVPGSEGGPALLALPANDKVVVSVQLRFRSGAVEDPPGKAGLTHLAAQVMAEGGTQALDAKALLDALFPIAADLSVRVDKEETTFLARAHRDVIQRLVPILIDVVLHPRWDPHEFARIRDAVSNDVEKRLRQGDDENLAKEALGELMYRDHPYGRLALGHVRDLRSITLDDVKAQAGRLFTRDRLTIGIAGGYGQELPGQLVKALAALPAGRPPREIPAQEPRRHPRFLLVEKPGDSTAISLGYPWPLARKDPDWPALSVARSAMGEHRQFNGRLMQRLREQRGLNYGDYAYLEHFVQEGGDAATAQTGRARHQQEFSIWLRPVQNANRLFAVRAALSELSRSLGEEPFSPEEVEQTKGFLDGYLLLFDQTDERKLGYALDDDFYGMEGFLAGWRAALSSVNTAQVNAAWRKWVDPGRLQIVMVGPGMEDLRRQILASAPSPLRSAGGPAAALRDGDAAIESWPLGAADGSDVEIVPVDRVFE